MKQESDTLPFHPYYTVKDGFGLGVFLIVFFSLVFFAQRLLGHPDNYIEANPLVDAGAHRARMVLPAVLRDPACLSPFDFLFFPAKLLGVIAMFGSILVWFFLPWLDKSPVRSGHYRPLFRKFFWFGLIAMIVLFICGGAPAEEPYVMLSQIATAYYFLHFLVILPIVSQIEVPKPLPFSITEAVLGSDKKAVLGENASPAV